MPPDVRNCFKPDCAEADRKMHVACALAITQLNANALFGERLVRTLRKMDAKHGLDHVRQGARELLKTGTTQVPTANRQR